MFQAEISGNNEELIFVKGGKQCLVDLKEIDDEEKDFINLGQVVCTFSDVHNQVDTLSEDSNNNQKSG